MKTIKLSGYQRHEIGKTNARELRYQGQAPCVLYGGTEIKHFSVFATDLRDIVFTPDAVFVEINVDGKVHRAIMQDIQFHPVTDLILHIDFFEIFDNKAIVMNIPVKLTGTSPGVKIGGKLVHKIKKLKVRAFPNEFTDTIDVSLENLELNKSIRVGELEVGKLELLNAKAETIVTVIASRALKQAETEAAKDAKKKK